MNKQEYDKEIKRLKEKKQNIQEVIAHAKQALKEAKQYLKDHDLERLKLECVKLYGKELVKGDILEVQFPSYNAKTDVWGTRLVRLYFERFEDNYAELLFQYADEKGVPIPSAGYYPASTTDLKSKMFREAILITP